MRKVELSAVTTPSVIIDWFSPLIATTRGGQQRNQFTVIIGLMLLLCNYVCEMGISFDELAAVLQEGITGIILR